MPHATRHIRTTAQHRTTRHESTLFTSRASKYVLRTPSSLRTVHTVHSELCAYVPRYVLGRSTSTNDNHEKRKGNVVTCFMFHLSGQCPPPCNLGISVTVCMYPVCTYRLQTMYRTEGARVALFFIFPFFCLFFPPFLSLLLSVLAFGKRERKNGSSRLIGNGTKG